MSASRKHSRQVTATRRRRAVIAPLVALATAIFIYAGAGAASATDPDPVGDLVKHVQQTVHDAVKPARASVPSQNAPDPSPADDDDSPGHETANPQAPDHGSSHLAHGDLAGQDLVDLGSGRSGVNDDGSTTADSTLLAVGGQEIIGSHASSDGTQHSEGAVPAIPVCEQSSGAVCLDLLYSDSQATSHGSSADSSTSNGIANLCLGGNDPSGETCTGPAQIVLGGSDSSAHRNLDTGRTTASSGSELTSVCLQRDPVLGTCTASADLVSSDGKADSDGSSSRHSQVAGLNLAGNPAGLPTEPFAISVPPDCTSPSVLCIFGNQGETYVGDQLAGTAQTALDLTALDDNLHLDLAHSETLAHNAGGRPPVVSPPQAPTAQPAAQHNPITEAVDGVLPNTGGIWSGLLALGLGLFATGAIATAWDRRRTTTA
jgi:hypothetical protein